MPYRGLGPGEWSAVVRIPSGYAILKVLGSDTRQAPKDSPVPLQALSGAGAVRLTYDYAGFAAALRVFDKVDKPAGWNRDLRVACEARSGAVPAVMGQLKVLLARAEAPPGVSAGCQFAAGRSFGVRR